MVDLERLHRILRRITDDLDHLGAYADADRDELVGDPVRLGHLKYLFITAIEGCIDAAQHVCASEGYGPPQDNDASAVRLLAAHGALDGELADEVAAAVGFRNLLVHGYADIDDERVVSNLDRVADLEAYVDALARLLDA